MSQEPDKPVDPEKEFSREKTGLFLLLMSAAFGFYLVIFILVNVLHARWLNVGVLSFFLALIVASLFLFRDRKNLRAASSLMVVSCFLISVFSFWTGGSGNAGFIWGFVFTPLAFYIHGRKAGILYGAGLLVSEVILTLLAHAGITGFPFKLDLLMVLFSAYVILVVFLSVNEHIQDQYQKEIADKSRQLDGLHHDLEHLATMDYLTDLHNRRKILSSLREEIERFNRYQVPVSVILLDADRFHTVNETHGQPFGDEVLRLIARILKGSIRDLDRAGRFGGEEFLVLLPSTSIDDAEKLAERIRKRLRETPVRTKDGGSLHITASFGAAELRAGEDESALVARVDHALQKSKADGRDRVTRAG